MNNFTQRMVTAFLLTFLLFPPAFAKDVTEKVKAADLVSDGQIIDLQSQRYQDLFTELRNEHGFSQPELDQIFAGVAIKRRVLELMDSQWEAKPYYQYWPRFITPAVVAEGRKMLVQYKDILDRVEKELGVEREVVVAIWGIETRFGKHKGGFDMLQTLNTMFDAYPRRSKFYRKQLIHFLLLCRENDVDPRSVLASYGGAFGQTQFIPSSFREYAVDFDKDGRRDVWNSEADVLASIANYLKRFHWVFAAPVYVEIGSELHSEELTKAYQKGRKSFVAVQNVNKAQSLSLPPPPKNKNGQEKNVTIVGLELDEKGGMRYVAGYPNFQAITQWNHSNRYAMAVTELAERLAAPQ